VILFEAKVLKRGGCCVPAILVFGFEIIYNVLANFCQFEIANFSNANSNDISNTFFFVLRVLKELRNSVN